MYPQNKGKTIVSCLICHGPIEINFHQETAGLNLQGNYARCLNGHAVHLDPCLKNWIIHSEKCPLCNGDYDPNVINYFKDYIEQVKKEQEIKAKAKEIAQSEPELDERKVKIKELLVLASELIKGGKYVEALDKLYEIIDNYDKKDLDALFLIGKANFLRGRYDLAINNFMKLVKMKFDYPLAFYYLGRSYLSLGLPDKTKWAYERGLRTLRKALQEDKELSEDDKIIYQGSIEEMESFLKAPQ
ncbi:MAG: hypothetical protein ACTSU2_04375 [Promethearchaeota archaeon]